MAVITRYVNTASSAGGDGTTNGTSGATRAYVSLTEWDTQEQTDAVTDTDTHIVNCVGSTADTGNVQVDGWTTDATYFITINGDNTLGKYSTAAYRIEHTAGGSYEEGINVMEGFTECYDLQVQMTSSQARSLGLAGVGTEVDFTRCIVKGVLTGSPGAATTGIFQSNVIAGDIFSCLVFDWIASDNAPNGFNNESTTTPSFGYNLTAYNCSVGFGRSYNDFTLRNCLAQACTDGFITSSSGWLNPTHNASNITSDAPGTSSQTGTVSFVDSANDDFQPTSSDTVAKDNGFDLSGTFDFDLKGDAMPATWPIGCLQAISSAVVVITDVNTTESWTDGDTGLVITGTGFV